MMSRRRVFVTLLLLSAVFNGGCEQEPHLLSKYIVQPGEAAEFGYQFQWQTDLGLRGAEKVLYAELVSNDRMVTLESDNVLQVIDTAGQGRILWNAQVAKPHERLSRPQLHGDKLIICSQTRAYMYDILMGELVKVIELKYISNTQPLLIDDYMIHGSSNGIVYAQDLNNGLIRWIHQMGSPITSNPTRAGNAVLITTQNGQIASFLPRDGTLLWAKNTWDKVSAKPTVGDRFIYVASEDQSLYALTIGAGTQRWRHYGQGPLTETPEDIQGVILQKDNRQGLVALNGSTGQILWTNEKLGDASILQVVDGILMVHRKKAHSIAMVSLNDGQIAQEVVIPAVHHVISDNKNGGNLYAMRVNGLVMKLSPR
ncbi:MAG: outer membrane protein assembly factor BamB family protein [Planctomycetota bacterium]|jgi:outer membrane protein assembly factor BamB